MTIVQLVVNGNPVSRDVDDRTLLVDFLRRDLGLTGTHVGCDTSQCGACTVKLDGAAVKACAILAAQAGGGVVETIEGLARGDSLHPVQQAFIQCHGLQCGFCTPGMVMACESFLSGAQASLDDDAIHHALEGNICRCTGYVNIIAAVKQAGKAMGVAASCNALNDTQAQS
jgi:carbon-monoxide dehydrogenase small subunit